VSGANRDSLRVTVGEDRLEYRLDPQSGALARPLDTPTDFDWQSAFGLYLRGKEWLRQREYGPAATYLDSALARDPYFVPALTNRAMLAIRALQYEDALGFATTALQVDTYDGAANYYYGLANRELGRLADAKDGFEIATLSAAYRGAAWTELAQMSLAAGDVGAAVGFANKALTVEPDNLDALGVVVVAARRQGDRNALTRWLARLEEADPLSHQVRLERLLAQGDPALSRKLADGIQSELPEQALFELAAWYVEVGDSTVAGRVLEAAGDVPEALYWRASLLDSTAAGAALLTRANALSPRFVFPFRREMVPSLEWAVEESPDWKPRYYLALAYWGSGRVVAADSLLTSLGDTPDYAPFYAARASLPGRSAESAQRDLERAAALDPAEWRYGRLLADWLLAEGDSAGAAVVARQYAARFPDNYILGLTLATALVANGEYRAADSLLATLEVLPYEGRHDGHVLYRQAKLMLAVAAIGEEQWDSAAALIAAARLWPERLGAGKPYEADIDERLENLLLADVRYRSGKSQEPAQALLATYAPTDGDALVLRAWKATTPGRPVARWLALVGIVLGVVLVAVRFRRARGSVSAA